MIWEPLQRDYRGCVAIGFAAALAGCAVTAAPAPALAPSSERSPSGFDHSLHSGADAARIATLRKRGTPPACRDCHILADARTGALRRPGAAEHAPCDGCHRDAFFAVPGKLCRTCHVAVDARAGAAPLSPWPPGGAVRRYAAVFNHRLHLDKPAMEQRYDAHIGCVDCHQRQPGGEKAQLAGHAACAPCHGDATKPLGIRMNDCRACHVSEDVAVPQGRRLITRDLKFSHARHEKDAQGGVIVCVTCHAAVTDATDVAHIMLPAMLDCARCHEDPARTPPSARIANCALCHDQIVAGVAPRNHLGAVAPDTHTIAFRSDHAEAARSPQARCRFCHGGLSSTTKDNCFECHVVMKPRDHTLRWATYDHGPEAAIRRERCAICHEADYCASCHSQRPRSHTPFDSFVNGGHGLEARLNMRACLACHTYEDSCARCHAGAAFPGGRPR